MSPSVLIRLTALLGLALTATTQELPPAIHVGGIVNAASFVQNEAAPGAIVSVFGEGLAPSETSASRFPLPTELGGTVVLFGDDQAPLFYVSDSQINAQVPEAILTAPSTLVTVRRSDGQEAVQEVKLVSMSPAAFVLDGEPCGQGAVLNVDASGLSVNDETNAADRGGILAVFGTGLGRAVNQPPDGFPAPETPPAVINTLPGVRLGPWNEEHVLAEVLFVGKAPGLAGVDQLNLRVPDNAPLGCSVPLTIQSGSVIGPAVSIHLASDGKVCKPRAARTLAALILSEVTRNGGPPQATLNATFQASAFAELPPVLAPTPGCRCSSKISQNTACDRFAPVPLDAGAISFSGPGFRKTNLLRESTGRYAPAALNGVLAAGAYQIVGSGGADVGAFESSIVIPDGPLDFTKIPTADSTLSSREAVTVRWTGGAAESLIVLEVSSASPGNSQQCRCIAAGDAGEVVLGTVGDRLPIPGRMADVTVTELGAADVSLDDVSGLTLGGIRWSRVQRITGIPIR